MTFALPTTTVNLSDSCTPTDVIDAIFLGPFLAGDQPVAASRRIDNAKEGATLLPDDAVDVRRAHIGTRVVMLAQGDGWTLHISKWGDQASYLMVTAVDDEVAKRVLDDSARDAIDPEPEPDDVVRVGFWSLGSRGPARQSKSISARPWPEIRRNYTGSVADAFDQLMGLRADRAGGRLLLFHGPPGTGKTTVMRALAHAWREWCSLEYVLDPEKLLRDPGYLLQAASGDGEGSGTDGDGRWRLLVLEDCDELIHADAKSGAGQSLARLLNLTDGILGQGLDVLVAITTNEPLARLHPAIVRPGRCLAQVEVGRLTPAEARAWLGSPVLVPADGITLADLYARSTGGAPIEAAERAAAAGGYL